MSATDELARPPVQVRGPRPGPIPTRPPLGGGRIETAPLGAFPLEGGATLPALGVAYRHDGPPPPAPQVLVIHALTGSADAAGDWWAPLIGPGRALDTDSIGVLCANLLGGCYGTSGPRSTDPRTARPYGTRFPQVSVRDQARAQWALLDALGIERLSLVVGGSLGGMVALEVALARPGGVDTLMPIAAPASTGALALAWDHLQLELIARLGDEGLDLARRLAMTTYRSEYYVGLLAGENDLAAAARTGDGREINRHNFSAAEVGAAVRTGVVRRLVRLIELRNEHPAFDGEFQLLACSPQTLRLAWSRAEQSAVLDVDFESMRARVTTTDQRTIRQTEEL